MIRAVLALAVTAAAASPALARPSEADLARVGVHAPPGATAPFGLAFRDQDGRPVTLGQARSGLPAVLVFADYRCRTLCGPALAMTGAGLTETRLARGRDYHLVVVGLNPASTPDEARAFGAARLGALQASPPETELLTGTAATIAAATRALGYGYAWDPATGQFTHPAAAFVLTPEGRVARVLSELGLQAGDLRLALVEAGRGRVGTLVDRLNLLCHGFDAVRGAYDDAVAGWLRAGGVATVLLMGAAVGAMLLRGRRAAR